MRINLGFTIRPWAEPGRWRAVHEELGLDVVRFRFGPFDPRWPEHRQLARPRAQPPTQGIDVNGAQVARAKVHR